MTTVAIMQPTYLPWLGYFDLIDQADVFIFLESVQFDKRSWQQRNRIKTQNGELMLTVPVLSKGKFEQKINDVMVDESQNFEMKHFNSICSNYNKSKFFHLYRNELESIYNYRKKTLVDLNIILIKWLCEKLGITSEFLLSSQLGVYGSKVNLLINIINKVMGKDYLSPAGAKNYINDNNLFKENNIRLIYQNYQHPIYKQLHGNFISFLSVLDLLFNEGDSSLDIIRSGRKY